MRSLLSILLCLSVLGAQLSGLPVLAAQENAPEEVVPPKMAGSVQSEDFVSPEIAAIDQEIMLECIKLARFNLHFHGSVNQKTFMQEWIYPMEREAGTALSFSNTITDLSQRARGLGNPSKISKPSQKRGIECALVGQAITGTSSSIALGTNIVQSVMAAKRGYSPARSVATVKSIADNIDRLLAQRKQSILDDGIDDKDQMYAIQGRLLEHLKNQLVFEFKTWSIRSRSEEWSENTFYTIDALQGYTQLASSCASLKSFTSSTYGGAAAITNLVANAMVMFNPVIKGYAGRLAAERQRRHLDKVFPREKPKDIDQVLAEWGKSTEIGKKRSLSTLEASELAFLVRRSAEMDGPLNEEVQKFVRLRRIADQQSVSGPLIGLSAVMRGTLNTTAYYVGAQKTSSSSSSSSSSSGSSSSSSSSSSTSSSSSQANHNKLVSNELNFAGRIVQSTGQVYSLIVTPTTEIKHFLYHRRLKRTGNLPAQITRARLDKLDLLESRIKASKF